MLTDLTAQWHALDLRPAHGRRMAVVVGVSGGMDSVVLVHALAARAADLGLDLHVAHVDHGLRPSSADEAAFVADLAATLGLASHHCALDASNLHSHPSGIEAAARRARYRFFFQVAGNVTPNGQVPTVAVAHHAEDQAETVVLNLMRGAGLRGLGGMRLQTRLAGRVMADGNDDPVAQMREVRIVRPFLHLPRAEIGTYAARHSLAWCEDASNADVRFTRNYVRHQVLPALGQVNPQIVATLGRTAAVLADEWDRIAAYDRRGLEATLVEPRTLSALESETRPVRVVLALRVFNALDRATRRGVLRLALMTLTPADRIDANFDHIERILTGVASARTTGPHPIAEDLAWSVMGEWRNQRMPYLSLHRRDVLPFAPPQPLLPAPWTPVVIPKSGVIEPIPGWLLHSELSDRTSLPPNWHETPVWSCWLDEDRTGTLHLAAPRPGLTIAPTGMHGHTKSVTDLLGDAKIHQTLRARWPIVVDADRTRVLWVCGLRTAQDAAVSSETTRVRYLRWEERATREKG